MVHPEQVVGDFEYCHGSCRANRASCKSRAGLIAAHPCPAYRYLLRVLQVIFLALVSAAKFSCECQKQYWLHLSPSLRPHPESLSNS
jgi:hypothetical protein